MARTKREPKPPRPPWPPANQAQVEALWRLRRQRRPEGIRAGNVDKVLDRAPYAPWLAKRFGWWFASLFREMEQEVEAGGRWWILIKDNEGLASVTRAFRAMARRYPEGKGLTYRRLVLCVWIGARGETWEAARDLWWLKDHIYPARSIPVYDLDDVADIPQGRVRSFEHKWRLLLLSHLRFEMDLRRWDRPVPEDPDGAKERFRDYMLHNHGLLDCRAGHWPYGKLFPEP